MKLLLGILCAFLLHAAVVVFGGLIFAHDEQNKGKLDAGRAAHGGRSGRRNPSRPRSSRPKKELEATTEKAPDAAEIMRNLEQPAINSAPALDAAQPRSARAGAQRRWRGRRVRRCAQPRFRRPHRRHGQGRRARREDGERFRPLGDRPEAARRLPGRAALPQRDARQEGRRLSSRCSSSSMRPARSATRAWRSPRTRPSRSPRSRQSGSGSSNPRSRAASAWAARCVSRCASRRAEEHEPPAPHRIPPAPRSSRRLSGPRASSTSPRSGTIRSSRSSSSGPTASTPRSSRASRRTRSRSWKRSAP